jgi:hypothetical protein
MVFWKKAGMLVWNLPCASILTEGPAQFPNPIVVCPAQETERRLRSRVERPKDNTWTLYLKNLQNMSEYKSQNKFRRSGV